MGPRAYQESSEKRHVLSLTWSNRNNVGTNSVCITVLHNYTFHSELRVVPCWTTAQLYIFFPCYLNVYPSVHRTEILWPDLSTVRRFCTTHIATILKLLPQFHSPYFYFQTNFGCHKHTYRHLLIVQKHNPHSHFTSRKVADDKVLQVITETGKIA